MRNKGSLPVELRQKLLGAVLEFMAQSGVSEGGMKAAFDKGLESLRDRRLVGRVCRGDGNYVGNGNASAELLRLWHRDDKFIDEEAKPRPLLLRKGKNSLHAVLQRLDPNANASDILRGMVAIGLIRRTARGRYLPTSDSVTIGQLHPLAVEHVAKSVIRLVSTVSRNTDPARESLSLIERYAYVPDLNKADSMAFADFTRSQGMSYLQAVDDWLEQRRVRRTPSGGRGRGKGVTAGVHLVAYLGDGLEGAGTFVLRGPPVRHRKRTSYEGWEQPTPSREARA